MCNICGELLLILNNYAAKSKIGVSFHERDSIQYTLSLRALGLYTRYPIVARALGLGALGL